MDKFYSNAPTFSVSKIRRCQILVDCSTLLKCWSFKNAMVQLLPNLDSPMILARGTRRVIEDQMITDLSADFSANAKTSLANMEYLLNENKAKLYGDTACSCESALLHYIVHHRTKASRRLVLLTQNAKLAYDVLRIINNFESVKAPAIEVYRVNPDGSLGGFVFESYRSGAMEPSRKASSQPQIPSEDYIYADILNKFA